MNSDLPEVSNHLLADHSCRTSIECALGLGPDSIHVVYGHGGEQVRQALGDASVRVGLAGRATRTRATPLMWADAVDRRTTNTVLVLYGDVPAGQE